ncbi:MAG: hypothetical protein ACP5D7_07515 [Limnospira sp.]
MKSESLSQRALAWLHAGNDQSLYDRLPTPDSLPSVPYSTRVSAIVHPLSPATNVTEYYSFAIKAAKRLDISE